MKIETKYNIGDEVWVLCEGRAQSAIVMAIGVIVVSNGDKEIAYTVESKRMVYKYGEKEVFPTKEELLKNL